jgi:hypothetical protein
MTALAQELNARGTIDVGEAFIDASFAPAKKGGARSEKQNAATERRSWLTVGSHPFTLLPPLSRSPTSTQPRAAWARIADSGSKTIHFVVDSAS